MIATTGAVVSNVKLTAELIELLPAASLNWAVTSLLPSAPRSPAVTVRLTLPAATSVAVMRCITGCASGEPFRSSWTESPTATVGFNTAAKVGAVAAVMWSVFELPVSDAAMGFGVPPLGVVVSSVKLSEAAPVLPKASVWVATMVCTPSARPPGVNDQVPPESAITVEAIGLPSIVKCTTVLASPVPLSVASFEVMLSLNVPVLKEASLAVTVGAVGLSGKVTGLSVLALVAAVEVVATAGALDDVTTRPVEGIVSAA